MNSAQLYSLYCEYYERLKIKENLVFFESHNSIDFAGNMFYLAKEISQNPIFNKLEIIVSCVSDSEEKIQALLEKYSIKRYTLVRRETSDYMRILATAKYLFTDVAFYPLYRKKVGQVCITTWHGTPLKTLGYTFWEDSYVVPNQKRGFLLADYFVCPNKYTWDNIRKSYQLNDLFNGKVIYGGYPRNAIFYNIDRREKLRKEIIKEDKKVVVYMPTWRGKVVQVNNKSQSMKLQELLREIDILLPDNYEVWTKLHRLNARELDYTKFKHIKTFPEEYDTYDILNIADILITDYSSVMFDYAISRKKIILFCYDKKDYTENRKCYFDIEELPFPIVTGVDQVVEEICCEKKYHENEVLQKFCKYDCLDSAELVLRDIIYKEKNCFQEEMSQCNKKKNLIFVGELNENNETDSLFEFLSQQDKECTYISYMNHLFLDKAYRLLQFKNMNKVPIYMYQKMYANFTTDETKMLSELRTKISNGDKIPAEFWEIQDKVYRREYTRYTYQNHFEKFIRYAGLDLESLKWFRVFNGEKIIFIHDNMAKKAFRDLEYLTHLKRAMEVADEIHYVNRDIFEKIEQICGGIKGKKIVNKFY